MKNIIDSAVAAGNFKTLVAAIQACKLESALSGVTVFAPNDAAFAKLPSGTVDKLLKDIPKLTAILKYHLVKGEAKPTRNGITLNTMLDGSDGFPKELSVKITVGVPVSSFLWGGQDTPAQVLTFVNEKAEPIRCDNGIIHVIDQVLIPYEGNEAPQHN